MELSNQLPRSHPLTAPVHSLERVTGPPELHHSEGRYLAPTPQSMGDELGTVVAANERRCWIEAGELLKHRHHILGLASASPPGWPGRGGCARRSR